MTSELESPRYAAIYIVGYLSARNSSLRITYTLAYAKGYATMLINNVFRSGLAYAKRDNLGLYAVVYPPDVNL